MVKGGVTYRLVADHLGSPRLVVDASTGVVVQEMRYDEFGRITLDTNPGFQPFGFAGGLYDHQTGLVRFGARDYDPEVGRWLSRDPSGFDGSLSNLYAYVDFEPINWSDPDGFEKRAQFLATGKTFDPVRHAAVRVYDTDSSDSGTVYSHGGRPRAIGTFDEYLSYYDPEKDPTVGYDLDLSEEEIAALEKLFPTTIGPKGPRYSPLLYNCAQAAQEGILKASGLPEKSFLTKSLSTNGVINDLFIDGLIDLRSRQVLSAPSSEKTNP